MTDPAYKGPYFLSYFILILMIIAAGGGLVVPDVYRDSETIKAAWFGNDIVTLFVVCPALLISLRLVKKGSRRAQIFWMGLLSYTLYNFAFYLFGAQFNTFFLLYVTLFTASIYALILGLTNLDVRSIQQNVSAQLPSRAIGVFLLAMAIPLAIFELSQCIGYLTAGKLPAAPPLIFALDLSFVITTMVLAVVLLWKGNPWGYVLSVMMLVKGITYGLVLIVGTAAVAKFSFANKWDPLTPYYVFVAVGSIGGCYIMLRNLNTASFQQSKKQIIESSYSG